jgi:hypothetical protein
MAGQSGTYKGQNPFTQNPVIEKIPGGSTFGQLIDPGNIFAPNLVDTSGVTSAAQGAQAQSGALGAERQLAGGDQQQARQMQLQALGGLQSAANGTGPNAAAMQAEQMRQRNVANQYAMAASLRGRSPGAALAQAGQNAATINSQAAGQAAAQRAADQEQARRDYVTALGGLSGQDIQRQNALLGAQLTSQGQGIQGEVGAAQASAANAAGSNSMQGGILSGAGSLIGAMSDERAKTHVHSGLSEANDMLDALSPRSFEYKAEVKDDPRAGRGERLGIMAQDMERSPMGQRVVRQGAGGMKELDVGKGLGAALAALAALNGRVRTLEARRV